MARPFRFDCEGACHHVMSRGDRGQEVCRAPKDDDLFVEKLARCSTRSRVGVRAHGLMPNHVPVYVCTREANLSRVMHALLTAYAVTFSLRHELSGHPFHRRYKAILVEDER